MTAVAARGAVILTLTLLSVCSSGATLAHAADLDPRWSARDVLAALKHASPLVRCVVLHEAADMDPYSVGDNGMSVGVAQIHERGLMGLFTEWSGGAERSDPYASISFLTWALDNGYAQHWSVIRNGQCG